MFKGITQEQYIQYGAILTLEQAQELTGALYTDYSFFNPILINEQWIITLEEIANCTNEKYQWVKDLEIINIEVTE
jgi:hypothetical protein